MVNVWPAAELAKSRTMGVLSPPPLGVMVIVPVYTESGVAVKVADSTPRLPPTGPVSVKLAAGASGATGFDAAETAPVPTLLLALTVNV
jgi:hypothetical protein